MILISEKRLRELVQKCLDDTFRSNDPSKMAEKVDHRAVNFHLRTLEEDIKEGGL